MRFAYLTKLYKRSCHHVIDTRRQPQRALYNLQDIKNAFHRWCFTEKKLLVLYKKVAQGDEGWKVGKNEVREREVDKWERKIKIIITLKISTQNVDFVHVFWSVSTLHHVWLAFNFNGKVRFTFSRCASEFSCLLVVPASSRCFSTRVTARS